MTTSPPDRRTDPAEGTLGDYFRVLRKYVWLLIFTTCGFVAAAAVVTFRMAPVFEAEATLEITPPRAALSMEEILAVDPFQREYFQTMVRRVRMREIVAPLFDAFALPGQTYEEFHDELTVEPEKDTNLIHIKLEGESPGRIANVVNSAVRSFLQTVAGDQTLTSDNTRKVLDEQAEVLRGQMVDGRRRLDEFMERNGLLSSIENEWEMMRNQLSEKMKQFEQARNQLADASANQEEVQRLEASKGDLGTIPFIASDESFRALETRLRQLEQELAEIAGTRGEIHPEYRAAVRTITEVRRQRDERIRSLVEQIKREYSIEEAVYKRLDADRADLETRLREVDRKRFEYDRFVRDVDRCQADYERYLRSSGQLGPATDIAGTNVKVREWAIEPLEPVRPRKALNLSLAAVAGLLLGVFLAFLLDHLDDSLRTAADVQHYTGLPLLGMVPDMGRSKRKLMSMDRVSHTNPDSPFAEAYRSIRTSVTYSSAGEPVRLMLVTSAESGEGKTTTAANLAICFAQAGLKTLLVDADLRLPRLHDVFGITSREGLSSILARGLSLRETVFVSEVPHLHVLAAGPLPPNPSELLGSEKMRDLLREMRAAYDRVVIDSPPTALMTDACVVAPLADAVLQVVLAGSTSRRLVCHGRDKLLSVGGRLLGAIMNASRLLDRGYKSYYSAQGYRKRGAPTTPGHVDPPGERKE